MAGGVLSAGQAEATMLAHFASMRAIATSDFERDLCDLQRDFTMRLRVYLNRQADYPAPLSLPQMIDGVAQTLAMVSVQASVLAAPPPDSPITKPQAMETAFALMVQIFAGRLRAELANLISGESTIHMVKS